jgi:hypothetical protein
MYGRDTTKGNEEIDIGRRHEAQRLLEISRLLVVRSLMFATSSEYQWKIV